VERVTTVVIGAGHAGLATSRFLTGHGIDHVVLERDTVASSWRHQRWDSLRLLTPNRQTRLPGYAYTGPDPDGYMSMAEVVEFISGYADSIAAPVRTQTEVGSVRREGGGYRVGTSRGELECRAVVIATGACNLPVVPACREALPPAIECFTPFDYKRPEQLPDGRVLVVGASATGVQLADDQDVALILAITVCVDAMARG